MNIVLVHGAWHGAWVWEPVVPALSKLANVIALELPGRQFETTLAYRKIDLHHYVEAIEACIQPLTGPIVLVGHSLAGLAISQVAENHPEKIAQLIYLTAFVPKNGETMTDMTSKIKTPGISTELEFLPNENKVNIAASQRTCEVFYHLCDSQVAQEALARLNPEPLKAFTVPVQLSEECFGQVNKTYIQCDDDQALLVADQKQMITKTRFNQVYEIHADHSPFASAPEALVAAIEQSVKVIT